MARSSNTNSSAVKFGSELKLRPGENTKFIEFLTTSKTRIKETDEERKGGSDDSVAVDDGRKPEFEPMATLIKFSVEAKGSQNLHITNKPALHLGLRYVGSDPSLSLRGKLENPLCDRC